MSKIKSFAISFEGSPTNLEFWHIVDKIREDNPDFRITVLNVKRTESDSTSGDLTGTP